MDNTDFYKTLGVEKNATQEEISAAYKKLAKQLHPDLQQGKSDAEKKEAEEKFKNVNAAYEVLSDEEKRKEYDVGGKMPFGKGFGSAEEMFSAFASRFGGFPGNPWFGDGFGPREQRPKGHFVNKDGNDLEVNIQISLHDAIFGATKKLSVPTQTECPDCHGTGSPDGKTQHCKTCKGKGFIEERSLGAFGIQIVQTVCPDCGGSGISIESLCKKCSGSGRTAKNTEMNIPIPPGVKTMSNSNQRYCFKGAGICGVNGGNPGNLYVRFHEAEDELFKHSPDNPLNLRTICHVNPFVAIAGGTIEVYTPGGMKKCKIPEFTPPGKMFKVKNTWQPTNQGDLEVIVVYDMPTKMSAKLKKALGKIIEADDFDLKDANTDAKLYNKFNKQL